MPVTNLMKDIVVNTLDEVLKKEEEHDITVSNRDDIIAYVLNRVPPKYVTSERGLLHGILDAKYKIQQRVDILFLIYEAIYKILKRRDTTIKRDIAGTDATHFLPHVVGQVLEESNLSIIPDVSVSLIIGAKNAPMVDSDWENPYKTNEATKGHYHFWPLYTDTVMGKGPQISFTLTFRHPKFVEKSIDITLDVIPKSDFGKSLFVPIVLMKAKDVS